MSGEIRTNITQLRQADWGKLEADVVKRIRMLRAVAHGLEPSEVHDKIAQDLVLPAVGLLCDFCLAVQLEDEAEEEP